MKRIFVILVAGMLLVGLAACETMKGLGKDVEDAGEWVQEKAN